MTRFQWDSELEDSDSDGMSVDEESVRKSAPTARAAPKKTAISVQKVPFSKKDGRSPLQEWLGSLTASAAQKPVDSTKKATETKKAAKKESPKKAKAAAKVLFGNHSIICSTNFVVFRPVCTMYWDGNVPVLI